MSDWAEIFRQSSSWDIRGMGTCKSVCLLSRDRILDLERRRGMLIALRKVRFKKRINLCLNRDGGKTAEG